MTGELGTKFVGMRKVQFQKMNFPVLQILFATGRADSRPHAILPFQRFLNDEASDKTACARN